MSWFKILIVTIVIVCGSGISMFDCAVAQTIEELEERIAQLEALLLGVTRDGNDITFKAVNLRIVNGTGSTDGAVNGLGNLIVGYDEARQSGSVKTGSHNIVVGPRHNYSLYGGMVVGNTNEIVGAYATVSGGMNNQAYGYASSVSGGYNNTSGHLYSSVSGGSYNTASNLYSSVSGGSHNTASGLNAFVGGGGDEDSENGNEAYADYSAILGGQNNFTGDPESNDHSVGTYSSVSGGGDNTASGIYASVSGGLGNNSTGFGSSVSGGSKNTAGRVDAGFEYIVAPSVSGGHENKASWHFSSVSGGRKNTASMESASVSGGIRNTASGFEASVSGGRYNVASGIGAFVGGGGGNRERDGNVAFADYSSILGGWRNIAGDPDLEDRTIGRQSVVSAGSSNVASGNRSAVSGGYNNAATAAGASVSGGRGNVASALGASVSGGRSTSVDNRFDWAAGDLYEAD